VAVAVDENDIARPAQSADERQVRLVAGAEDDRVALPEPGGELTLELFVNRQRPVRGPRAGGARAVLHDRAAGRRDHVGVQREAQVVVRAEHQRGPALDDHFAGPQHAVDDGQPRQGGSVRHGCGTLFDGAEFVE
jgi:hypothetical protein